MSDRTLHVAVNTGDLDAAVGLLRARIRRIGVSAPIHALPDAREGAKAAAWALNSIRNGDRRVAYYGDVELALLPRSKAEARDVAHKVLGSLALAGERESPLLATLRCYLDNDRNWTATAAGLGVHRQTLGYRLKRIEEETGRSLKSTRDVAELWFACSAVAYLQG
ncbi:PucR family transcriptional regulator [Specibacter cremeus]|uniref:PucR family transcriptional regulator n=1 Tax=Specibacter cremeus TaxID=1629051 RepID=UPI0013DDBAA5|nr:helix-turn-helix domain-containing protein [Specibacter cremeus]